ncbi:MAG: phosphoglucosamine mutase [Elusimicrobiota bacterium]
MSAKLFGTDGVRGIPGKEPLTPETIEAIAYHGARELMLLRGVSPNGTRPRIALGRDTRGSGPALTRSLARGFAAAGAETLDLGVIPTPGVSYLAPRLGCFGGVVVSASHNPAEYNGIKFFDALGFKMAPALERRIEAAVAARRALPQARGTARPVDGRAHASLYADFLRSSFPATLDLTGVRLVVDCANGAAAAFAPKLLESFGAQVFAVGVKPDGRNINKGCGALASDHMGREVRRRRADAGVAFDGDADRALVCDERGALLDGDAVIGAAAARLLARGGLRGGKVALTVMSNYGLISFLRAKGVGVVTTPVGDRHVTEAIEREGLSLGGENSGHVVFRDFAPTGDGILTALQTLAAWRESGRPMSALRRLYSPTPQTLLALHVHEKPEIEVLKRTSAEMARASKALAGRGRVFVRYSGTEPVLRVLVEGPSRAENAKLARAIAKTFLAETGQTEEAHS